MQSSRGRESRINQEAMRLVKASAGEKEVNVTCVGVRDSASEKSTSVRFVYARMRRGAVPSDPPATRMPVIFTSEVKGMWRMSSGSPSLLSCNLRFC